MPIISRFFGIVIYMLWREHRPPHFHAKYGDEEIKWRQLRQEDLTREWEMVEQKKALFPIKPLE